MTNPRSTPCVWRGVHFPSLKEAAWYLDCHEMTARRHHKVYGNLDLIPPASESQRSKTTNAINYQHRNKIRAGGSFKSLIRSLEPEVAIWFVKSIPHGLTASEFVRSLIIDAYDAEQDDQSEI